MRLKGNKKKLFNVIFIFIAAIQKLFEIRIFGCARGDFTTSGRPLVFYRNIKKISVETEIECDCIGLIIRGILKNIF